MMPTRLLASTCAALAVAGSAHAAILTSSNLTYTNTFDDFTGGGFQSVPANATRIDSDDIIARGLFDAGEVTLAFGGSAFSDYAKGATSGNSTSGGVYGFDVDPSGGINRGLGAVLDGNNFTPGDFVIRVTNDAGAAFASVRVELDMYYFSKVTGTSLMKLWYSVGSNELAFNSVTSSATAVPNGQLTSAGPVGTQVVLGNSVDEMISVAVPVGQSFYLYVRTDETGGRDNFAIDNLSISATLIPEPASLALVAAGGLLLLPRRRGEA